MQGYEFQLLFLRLQDWCGSHHRRTDLGSGGCTHSLL